MNFNDKFLNVCFKIGKVLFSILLIISLIITVVLFCKTGFTALKQNNVHMTYQYDTKPIFNEIIGISKPAQQNEISQDKSDKDTDKALEILAQFANDKQLPDNLIPSTFKLPTDDKEAIPYVKGFISFYDSFINDFKTHAKNEKKADDKVIDKILKDKKTGLYNDILELYIIEYQKEYDNINKQKSEIHSEININLTAALISLAIFILFLFLPILIRIEENTRK